ncbi:MAG: flippase-like domain-containing protein [Caldilineaceae bacterium]|nr:flippase-like domain-containing protein [Caldilineaceae bacterium]
MGHRPVLYPFLVREDDNSENGSGVELLSIMVDPAVRGQGIGAQLLARLVEECTSRRLARLNVTVDEANAGARRFYARHGFALQRTFSLYGRRCVASSASCDQGSFRKNRLSEARPDSLPTTDATPQPGDADTRSQPGWNTGYERLRLDPRRASILAGLGLLTVLLLLVLGDGRAALAGLRQADWRLVGLAVLIHYSGFAMRGHRWQLLLRSMDHRLTYLYTTGLLLSGWFISALLPARSGDIFRVGVLRLPPGKEPAVPVADGVGSIVLERVLDILAILILGLAFGYVAASEWLPEWILTAYGVGVLLLVGLAVALLAAPSILTRLGRLSSAGWWQTLLDFADQLVTAVRRLPQRPGLALLVVAESFYIWLCDVLLLWLAVRSLGGAMSLTHAGFVALSVDVLAAVPLTPGGVGQIEAAYAALLALLPASLSTAAVNIAAVILVTRAISYWSFLLFSGIVAFAAGFGQLLGKPAAAGPAAASSAGGDE